MKQDIFAARNCFWVCGLVGVFIVGDILTRDKISDVLWTVFFFVLGAACLWNYQGCGRVHCQITGFGFLAVGVLASLNVLGVIELGWNIIWIIFAIVLIIGYGIEYKYKTTTGSCYK